MSEIYAESFREVFASSDIKWGICICAGCCPVSANFPSPYFFNFEILSSLLEPSTYLGSMSKNLFMLQFLSQGLVGGVLESYLKEI